MGGHAHSAVRHFNARCAERGIPLSAERVTELARRMAPLFRAPGRRRYALMVRLKQRRSVTVIWDDEDGVPVSAWWRPCDVNHPVEIYEGWR